MPIGRLNNFNDLEWSRRVNSDNNPSPTSVWETTLRNGSKSEDDTDYNNTVIAWPPQLGGLGETARLQNYVLFDIYDTGGERLDATRDKDNFVNFDQLREYIGKPLDNIRIGNNEQTGGGDNSSQSQVPTAAAIGALIGAAFLGFGGVVAGSLFATTIQRFGGQFMNVSENVNLDFEKENNKNNLIEGKLLESFNSTALGLSNRTKRIGLSIALPMPAQLNSNYGLDYADTDFNTMSSVLSSMRLYSQSPQDKDESLEEELGRKLATVGFSAIDSLSSILKSEGLNTKEFSEQFLRQAPNRFSEKTFKGVERRKFEMSFSVSPRSVEEAKIITSIIYAFKKFSHPKLTKGGLYLDYPAQFRIGFYNKTEENDFLYKMGLCACTRVSVTYGKDMLGFLREIREGIPGDTDSSVSGAPANSMEILLSFEELELLTRQRIEAGY